jgi:hypothetical protein
VLVFKSLAKQLQPQRVSLPVELMHDIGEGDAVIDDIIGELADADMLEFIGVQSNTYSTALLGPSMGPHGGYCKPWLAFHKHLLC